MMISAADFLKAKKRLLKLHYDAHVGHIGGNISCFDTLMILHHCIMEPEDRFILSKGHAAGALYVALWSLGKLSEEDLRSFAQENTFLPGHPSGKGIPGLMFSTGSLGHGPSLAAGMAMATRYTGKSRNVYCLCSDGEWQEGSCWEALTFAVHHRLSNLTILIDQNGLQGFGRTEEVTSCADLTPRIAAFGADVQKVDGHNPTSIMNALAKPRDCGVRVVVLETVKGRGLHFEGRLESHYLPLTEEQFKDACAKLEREGAL